jgi:adenylate cyclase
MLNRLVQWTVKHRRLALGIMCGLVTGLVMMVYVSAYLLKDLEGIIAGSIFEVDENRKVLIPPWYKPIHYALGQIYIYLRPVRDVEYETKSIRAIYGRYARRNDELVFIAIDQRSLKLDGLAEEEILQSRPLELMRGSFPFSREVYAFLLDRLMKAGAKLVLFDLVFSAPMTGDDHFEEMLKKYRGKVIVGSNIVEADREGNLVTLMFPTESVVAPEDVADFTALVNIFQDDDGVFRQAAFTRANVFEPQPTFVRKMLELTGREHLVPPDNINLGYAIRYVGPPFKTGSDYGFQPYSLYEIFAKEWDTVRYRSGEFFRDKIVLVGPDGNFLQDKHLTPFGLMPGPEIHLNIMNAVLNQDFIVSTTWPVDLLLIFACGFCAWLFLMFFRSPALAWTMFVLFNIGYAALALLVYNNQDLYILFFLPLVAFNGSGLAGSLVEFAAERLEKWRTRQTLERYVSKNLVKELLDNPDTFYGKLGGVRLPITVLFSDVRGFTTMTESAVPEQLVGQLNEYLEEMTKCVFDQGGTLDKFIGDAVMAVWGNIRTPGVAVDARSALRTAVAMRAALAKLNERWAGQGMPQWQFGIGLNQGEAIAGSIGSSEKQDATVIGDAVNVGARIESYTKQYHLDLLIGEPMAEHVEGEYHLRRVDKVVFKGKNRATEILTVLRDKAMPLSEKEAAVLRLYDGGLELFRPPRRDFDGAKAKFEEALRLDPDDYLCTMYIERCIDYAKNPPPPDWQGEEVAKTK